MQPRSQVFDTYWYLAAERQEIFFGKKTSDPILQTYKFCNSYRASDRVSQFLIRNVIYDKKYSETDTLFRIFFFRLFNRSETWQQLEQILGEISLTSFSFAKYAKAINELNKPVYGNAFILCANKAFGYSRKFENHLALLESVNWSKLAKSRSLEELFKNLRELPLIGDFMAYQIAIDMNYSEVFNFSENDFTIAGPGAKRGIQKCFVALGPMTESQIIKWMVDNQAQEFARLGIKFKSLWGRPLHAIDCQGLFCETDKYCRVKFPNLASNRSRIKAKYMPAKDPINYFYPPKWRINTKLS